MTNYPRFNDLPSTLKSLRERVYNIERRGRGDLESRYNSANQTIPNGSFTLVSTPTALLSKGGISYSSGVWTLPARGRYLVEFQLQFQANATGSRYVRLDLNGTSLRRFGSFPGSPGGGMTGAMPVYAPSSGATVGVYVYQTSGGNLPLVGDANRDVGISITYLGV